MTQHKLVRGAQTQATPLPVYGWRCTCNRWSALATPMAARAKHERHVAEATRSNGK